MGSLLTLGLSTNPLSALLGSFSWLTKPLGYAVVAALVMGVTFGMGDWHGRSIQFDKDVAQINSARDALNTQLKDDKAVIDRAHAEAEAARTNAADVVINRPVPVSVGCKIDASIIPSLKAIH